MIAGLNFFPHMTRKIGDLDDWSFNSLSSTVLPYNYREINYHNKISELFFRSLFLDGLLYAGSADSVEAAADLLSSKKIPEESALRWYLDLNFVKHASRGSLTALVVRLFSLKSFSIFICRNTHLLFTLSCAIKNINSFEKILLFRFRL